MKNVNQCFLVILCLLFFSCKKDAAYNSLNSSTQNDAIAAAAKAKWQGEFISYNGLPASHSVPDKKFIRNGHARINRDSSKVDNQNYYSTSFRLVVPDAVKIKGDSLNFEVGLKNPFKSTFYSPAHGRDVTLYLKGETNEASITNTATTDVDPDAQQRAGLKIGQSVKYNLPQLQYNFEEYGVFILQTFNNGLVAYRNNEYLSGLGYGNEPKIGRLKEIGIVFNGSGFIDYVKIYNSVNGKLLMSEDFNTDGQSTIIIWK